MAAVPILLSATLFVAAGLSPAPATAQQPGADATRPADLATLFEPASLVADGNGDGVPDRAVVSLLLGDEPGPAVLAAAAEIGARVGFETTALDLPLPRGSGGETVFVVGRAALAAAGLEEPGVDPTSLDAGEGVVALHREGERLRVLVQGGDDEGLSAAARLFAGVLPHTRDLSTPHLVEIRDTLASALAAAGVEGAGLRLVQARARAGTPGLHRLVVEVALPAGAADGVADTAAAALEEVGREGGPRWPGLASIEARLPGGRTVRLEGLALLDEPGPVPGRPGRGGKESLDLSTLYTKDGLLGDSDSDEIPDRVDALLAPGTDGVAGLPDLAARLGLESTGLVVPLVVPAAEVEAPSSHPPLVLAGTGNPLTDQLADSGRVDSETLAPGEGLIQLVPDAFGEKPALVMTGGDEAGAERALEHAALTLPWLDERGRDRPTLDDVEHALWATLAGRTPAGQAATGLYKLARIGDRLADRELVDAEVLISVEKAEPGLAEVVRARAASALGVAEPDVTVDDRDVQNAATLLEETLELPWEVDVFREAFRSEVLPAVEPGAAMEVEVRLSEPPALRAGLEEEARQALVEAGADPDATEVRVLSAFKQGYSWLTEGVKPRLEGRPVEEIVVRFREYEPPEEWPQQAMHTPLRWLHEIFPVDEVLARDLGLELEDIRFEMVEEGPTYTVVAHDASGDALVTDTFEPRWVVRPYMDRFQDYERVRVTTGSLVARRDGETVVDRRIVTDPESFWDRWQAHLLPAAYDHVMELHDGLPRGGDADSPVFGELRVELTMSEPDYRLGIDNEIHAPMDALHEEVYFGTLEFFDLLGRNSRGQGIDFPGRVVPVMRPAEGGAPDGTVRLTGFATSRPAVVVRWEDADGATGEERLDIPRIDMERPSARLARVRAGAAGIEHLAVRVRVDSDADLRDSLVTLARPLRVDEEMISAEQVEAVLAELEGLRAAGLYPSALAWPGLGTLEVRAEWSHEEDPEARRTALLAANGTPEPLPDWRSHLPDGWSYDGERIVQWEEPIPPDEGNEMMAKMAAAFPEATMYRVGESYLGREIWALDLMPPVEASHWSRAKATTVKPTVIYSARQHANEVSSTSHVLRWAELLLTDPEERPKLDRVNVVVHPFTNPDGAQLAYDLYRLTPDYILHAGYLGPLGQDITSGSGDDHPLYPESRVRGRLWEAWLPDVFLNPHGYPSHQVVQLFSEYQGLVRRGRVTERNWGFNKGWFMPGFGYVDSPRFPRHKDAAFRIRDYITRAINAEDDVVGLNRRAYDRYRRYGRAFEPDVYRIPLVDSVLIEMPLEGSSGQGGGFNPRVTVWSGTTEAPDETAYGAWMEIVAAAGLAWDRALTDYLAEGKHEVERSGSTFFGGVTLSMDRPRPPEEEGEEPQEAAADPAGGG